jgi:hypothetical protein
MVGHKYYQGTPVEPRKIVIYLAALILVTFLGPEDQQSVKILPRLLSN